MSAVVDVLKTVLQNLKRNEEHFRNESAALEAQLTVSKKALSKVQSDMKEIEEELSIR